MSKYKINQVIRCKVSSIKPYGIFVIVNEEYAGLIHISQINGKYIRDIEKYFKVGEYISARIIDIDEDKKQIKLSTINMLRSKNKKSKLHETTLGFELFDEILQDWIDEKIDEIEKNKN